MHVQMFSKGDFVVFLPPSQNQSTVVFQIINTLNIEAKYKEVTEMLIALNIYNDIIATATFDCTTRIGAKTKPLDRLTSLVTKAFVSKVSKSVDADLKVSTIKFSTIFPVGEGGGGCNVIIEPLMSNREKEYFVSITFKAHDMVKFNKFISQFGVDMIQKMLEES